MKHSVGHDLDLALAQRAVRVALDSYAERFAAYSPSVSWSTDSRATIGFKAKGVAVNGTVEVLAREILIDLNVPFLLRVFKKKAIDVVEREINVWIGKARNGELDA